jgi:Lipase (class 3)
MRSSAARRLGVLLLGAACAAGCGSADAASDSGGQDLGAAIAPHIAAGIERAHQVAAAGQSVADLQRKSVHFGNAYWLARLSLLSYSNEADIRSQLTAWGFDGIGARFFSNTCTDAFAFYVSAGAYAAVVFRGTEPTWSDGATDLESVKVPWLGAGLVHAGFHGRLLSIWNADASCNASEGLGSFLGARHGHGATGARALYMTGHSLGAALATLALAYAQAAACGHDTPCATPPAFDTAALYTFGSPKVGNESFAYATADAARGKTPIFRFVNANDLVPAVPTDLDPAEALFSNYRHVGDPGQSEESLEVWVQDRQLEVSDIGWHPPYSVGDHLGYLPPLELQARAHNQLH